MSEYTVIWIISGQAILIVLACFLYARGGRQGKWQRRFVGSLIASTALWLGLLLMGKFIWLSLLVYPLLITAYSMGYGAEEILKKVIRRSIIVLCTLLTGLLMCLIIGGKSWLILPLQAVISAGSVWLGVKNPMNYAPVEEFFICLLLTECLILYPFVGITFP